MIPQPLEAECRDDVLLADLRLFGERYSGPFSNAVHHREVPEHRGSVDQRLWPKVVDDGAASIGGADSGCARDGVDELQEGVATWHAERDGGIGDGPQVDVVVVGECALTEHHNMVNRSVEALVEKRGPGGDRLEL
jgi:hypothetical protein